MPGRDVKLHENPASQPAPWLSTNTLRIMQLEGLPIHSPGKSLQGGYLGELDI